jgi:inosine/xanthosine triphosphatase
MEVAKVAVGSRNPAKLQAVRQALQSVWPEAVIEGVDVPSGVSAMPLSDEECLRGARNRAVAARQALSAGIGIGLEGGVSQEGAGLMLMGWVAVSAADGREGIAGTARLPLPQPIAERVLAGRELGPLMDELLGEHKSNHRGGAIGALTGGKVLRSEAFTMAILYALAPFLKPEFYESAA